MTMSSPWPTVVTKTRHDNRDPGDSPSYVWCSTQDPTPVQGGPLSERVIEGTTRDEVGKGQDRYGTSPFGFLSGLQDPLDRDPS